VPDGILNLFKPRGPTSHDAVGRVRRMTGVRRVGHAGTLDPLATGVLVLCLGQATRVVEYLVTSRKTYVARIRLGETTDTYDAEGEVVRRSEVSVGPDQVDAILAGFRGHIMQTPPMYSAVKRDGVPLYRLARRGVEVERRPRPAEIFSLERCRWDGPELTLSVTCSAGTYVRALAHDIGQALGCGAHLTALERRASGAFRIEDSITLDEFAVAVSENHWRNLLMPIDVALGHFPEIHMDDDQVRRLRHGQPVAFPAGNVGAPSAESGQPSDLTPDPSELLVRVYERSGSLVALARVEADTGVLHPHKVFRSSGESECA